MYRIDTLADKALQLASQVGDGLKTVVPGGAAKWLQTGVALGAARTGTRVATHLVRRNPAMVAAAAAGAGVLWFLARRQQKKHENGGAIEGKSTRVDAKRVTSPAPRKRAAAKRTSTRRSTRTSSED